MTERRERTLKLTAPTVPVTIHAQSPQRALQVGPERSRVTPDQPLTLRVVLDPARAALRPGRSYEGEIAIEFGDADKSGDWFGSWAERVDKNYKEALASNEGSS